MSSFSLNFEHPRLLLLLIPLIGLSLLPFLRLPRHRRRTRNRVVSLLLHILILLLSVPLLAGVSFHSEKQVDTFDVIMVVDLSASNESAEEAVNRRIQAILEEENASDFRIGIVIFGDDQLYVSELSEHPMQVYEDYLNNDRTPDASATDIGEALLYAKNLLGELTNSRLILFSDGLETDGDALPVAGSIAREGVRVYAVCTEPELGKNEVQLNLLEVENPTPEVGVATTVSVSVQSRTAGPVRLTLYDNGTPYAEKIVTLTGGEQTVSMDYEPAESGLHELCMRVESENDTGEKNNAVYAYVYRHVEAKLLIVDGTGSEAAQMKEILSRDFDVTVVAPKDVPQTREALRAYGEVILMNVDAEDLPDGFDELLNTYVYEMGGGLFTVGGKGTYALGHMAGTRFEDMLPIQITDDEEQVLELVLIMDISASMSHIAEGTGRPKVEIAKEGAAECVKALNDSDFVGIITFDANAQVFQQISPATNRQSIINKINSIETGVGTYYSNALQIARTVLFNSKNNADKQHVIFLTDGSPSDTGYTDIIRSMVSKGITVSAIGICEETDNMVERVEEIARVGGGRSYIASDTSLLPAIMRQETELSQRELINERTVTPKYKDYSPVIQGINRLPALEGYIGVGAKPEAKVVYTAGTDPIYAEWTYGAGMVASFMSDLSGDWSSGFLKEENGQLFVENVIRHVDSQDDGGEDVSGGVGHLPMEFEQNNHTTTVRIKKAAEEGHTIVATVTLPDGDTREIPLNIVGSAGYEGSFESKLPGVYTVLAEETDADHTSIATAEAFVTFSYSEEYNAFVDPQDGYRKLDAICTAAGGRILLSEERIFKKESVVIAKDYDPSFPILMLLLALFLLDIAVRKFNFKWIHEIVRARREAKSGR